MKALVRKELTEISVPAGVAFLVVTGVWIGTARYSEAMLPPATNMLQGAAGTSSIAGVLFGYLQFSVERWRGKSGYLAHRGTGVEGMFVAKVVAGLAAAALVGLGPPLAYMLLTAITSLNRTILQASVVGDYVAVATCSASFYGLGALAANLRRRSPVGIIFLVVGSAALYALSAIACPPWSLSPSVVSYVALHLGFGAALLLIGGSVVRSVADPDLRLPQIAQIALAGLSIPFVFFPAFVLHFALLEFILLDTRWHQPPSILRLPESGEFLTGIPWSGGYRRIMPDGALGSAIEDRVETAYRWGVGAWAGASAAKPPRERLGRFEYLFERGELSDVWLETFPGSMVLTPWSQSDISVRLDREKGAILAVAAQRPFTKLVFGSRTVFDAQTDSHERARPFELVLWKSGPGTGRFSKETIVLRGDQAAMRLRKNAEHDSESLSVFPCLVDPEDGSLHRLDVLDPKVPIERITLPGNDRFIRVEPQYLKADLAYGRYRRSGAESLVLGERGRYSWNGVEFVDFLPNSESAPEGEAPELNRFRVVHQDPDPLQTEVRVLDAQTGREVYSRTFTPQTTVGAVRSRVALGALLLRAPILNLLAFTGVVRRYDMPGDPRGQLVDILHNGRRPWLMAIDGVVAAACAWCCARMMRTRMSSAPVTTVWALIALIFGPVALLVAWLLEPRANAKPGTMLPVVSKPVLVIQSA